MRKAGQFRSLARLLTASEVLPAFHSPVEPAIKAAATVSSSFLKCSPNHRVISTSSPAASLHISDVPYCSQRQIIPLGLRRPSVCADTWVAPDAVLIGDCNLWDRVSIWNGAVLRADLNSIRVSAFSSIGDRTVIHAARSSPTGLPASTTIGQHVVVGQSCLIRSAQIQHEVVIGDRCILLEGSVVEGQSVLAPGSLLPPGRLVPRGQLWAGNPARFVRDLTKDEREAIEPLAEAMFPLVDARVDEVLPTSEAYRDSELLRERLVSQSPEWAALLSGWESTAVTPNDVD